jgi:hypothetical protein
MTYNKETLPHYMKTAGKISVLAAFAGLAIFLFAFMVDVGQQEFQRVSAQTASTSLTVLNTPPVFTVLPTEVIPSSTTSPTNSGDVVQWTAVGTDSNSAPYFLLICSTNATPTANEASGPGNLGSAPPDCGAGATPWGVSTSTVSGDVAFVATTTVEAALFAESNDWFAWVCDDDPTEGECNTVPSQGRFGPGASSSSPFNMNNRPTLTNAYNDSPVDPGSILTFLSTSSDPDSVGGQDLLTIVVCSAFGDYNSTTNTCDTNFIASSSVLAADDVTASTTIGIPIRDQVYNAFVFLVDEHGHEAAVNGLQANFEVANVAPTVLGGDIDLNGGLNLVLSSPGGTTTGFTLDFTISDANSCVNTTGDPGSEITGYEVSVLRSGVTGDFSTSTNCNPQNDDYNPNGCYTNGVPFDVWQLACTASTTSCSGPTDETLLYECTFPLWFLADPTDSGAVVSPFAADDWIAAIAGGDDNFATSSQVAGSVPVTLDSAPYIDLVTAVIPYGALAPGTDTGTLSTTTTILNIGNTGLDQEVDGSAMCPGFVSTSTDCSLNGSSTVFTSNQQFSSTSLAYGSPFAVSLPTTTVALPAEVELDINKTTSTSTPATGDTFWGIAVPNAVTIAGSYTGLNTFYGITAETLDW